MNRKRCENNQKDIYFGPEGVRKKVRKKLYTEWNCNKNYFL